MAHTLIEKYKGHLLATALTAGVLGLLVLWLGYQYWDFITGNVLLYSLIKIIVILVPLLLGVAYLTYAERKIIGYMQVRIGPNRVGPRGWLQPIADAMKLLFRYAVATVMVPVGGVLGVFGLIQNRMRSRRYARQRKAMLRDLADQAPGESSEGSRTPDCGR